MVRVAAPDGCSWRVQRRWIPHRGGIGVRARFSRARLGRRAKGLGDNADLLAEGCGEEFFLGLMIVVGIVVFVIVGWPLLVLLVDFAWLAFAVVVGVLGRVIFRRPWRVEAVRDDGVRHSWDVVGFRKAGRQRDTVARALAAGVPPAVLSANVGLV